MITREFDYTADEFNADKPVQMATLEWSTVDENGYYHRHYWESEDYELNGIDHELNYCQPIDRDQAVDDEGHAMYDEYVFRKAGEEYNDHAKTFTSEQIEQFAQTW